MLLSSHIIAHWKSNERRPPTWVLRIGSSPDAGGIRALLNSIANKEESLNNRIFPNQFELMTIDPPNQPLILSFAWLFILAVRCIIRSSWCEFSSACDSLMFTNDKLCNSSILPIWSLILRTSSFTPSIWSMQNWINLWKQKGQLVPDIVPHWKSLLW